MAGEQLKLFSETYSNMVTTGLLNTYAPNSENFRVILLKKLDRDELSALPLMNRYVYGPPNPPVINSTPPTIATVDVQWKYTIDYSDTDIPEEDLSMTVENMPRGMIQDGNTLTWSPTETETTSNIKVVVSDGNVGTANAEQIFTITVFEITDEVVITSTPTLNVKVGEEYTYEVITSGVTTNTIVYTLSNEPVGMVITGNVITWIPNSPVMDSGLVTIEVSSTVDSNVWTNTQDFTLTVDYPITSIPEFELNLGKLETPQSESYFTGGKIIPGVMTVINDDINCVVTTNLIEDVKWTDLTSDVHGFAIIGTIPRIAPDENTFEEIGYQYLDNELAIRQDDLIIKWPNVNVNDINIKYFVRLNVQ
jgi:hypothetical protein